MQNFFHADTKGYREACRKASTAIGAVLALPALLSLMSLILQTRNWRTENFVAVRLLIPAVCVTVWLFLSLIIFLVCETRARHITRSTYFEIQKSAAVYSRYAGRIFADTGGVERKLWVIPYDGLKLSVKNGRLTFTGKIRYYEGSSDRLTYHIRRGAPEFDNWWFNDNGFTEVKSVTLPSCFTAQKTIFRHCRIAAQRYIKSRDRKKQTQSRPVPRPKMIYRQRKRNSYSELPTFDRKW